MIMGNNVSYQKECLFFKLNFELSSATSFDLDQSTVLSFWNEISYSGKNIVEKEETA